MHVQNCCFVFKTYCFCDVFIAVAVLGSQGPYFLFCRLSRLASFLSIVAASK